VLLGVNQLGTLLSVVIIDVVLAGDNAVVVGMAATGLPVEQRRNVICLGIAAATALRILFAYFAVRVHTSVADGFPGYVGRQIAQGPTALPASVR